MALLKRLGRLATRTGRFWTEAYVLYLAARDSRVPFYARLAAGAFAIYVLSPIDIVPDPIPLIGIVDDFLIIPIGLMLVRSLVPEPLRIEHRAIAQARQPERPSFTQALSYAAETIQRIPRPINISARDIPRMVKLKSSL
jgi:uncharacterized membrane protein YkvA (DUF1232 family)